MATNYHVSFVNPATAAVSTTVDVVSPDNLNCQLGNYLKSMHGKMGFEFSYPSVSATATQAAALDSMATAARRYGQMTMFVIWDG